MKFEIKELDNGWFLHGERRWGDDTDNEQLNRSYPSLKALLKGIQQMANREFKQREGDKK